jgi:malonyl-CoA decarboxylase
LRGTAVGAGRGSGVRLAREILSAYAELTVGPRIAFFEALATRFGVDRERIDAAVDAWTREGSDEAAVELHLAAEPRPAGAVPPHQPRARGTAALVAMREDLMDAMVHRDDLAAVDQDFVHLFSSWFNRGFLVLRHIDWSTPAIILEKIIRYERCTRSATGTICAGASIRPTGAATRSSIRRSTTSR